MFRVDFNLSLSLHDHLSEKVGSANADDENIILNPRFDDDLKNWSGRGCKIVLHDSMGNGKVLPQSGKFFASATERTQSWNGIQQDITGRVQRKLAYDVAAVVRVFGSNITTTDVRATVWVQTPNSREQYIGISKLVTLLSFLHLDTKKLLQFVKKLKGDLFGEVCRQQIRIGFNYRGSFF